MIGKLLFKLFGLGGFPCSKREEIVPEGIIFLEEGIKVTITLKGYRDAARRSSWKRRWCLGSIAMTSRRLAAFSFSSKLLDIALEDPLFNHLEIRSDGTDCLVIRFSSSHFIKNSTGRVEYRFYFPRAAERLTLLTHH